MWSHYAQIRKDQKTGLPLDAHSGFVIGFDTNIAPFKLTGVNPLIRVKYRKERLLYKHHTSLGDFQKQFFQIVGTKYLSWRYEREFRKIMPIATPGVIRDNRFLQLRFPKAIASVIFGCRCPIEYRLQVIQLLKRSRLRHVKLYAALDHPAKYKLDICKLERP